MTNRFPVIAAIGVLASFFAVVAWGQATPETEFTPKNYSIVDQNGVDLAQRSFSVGHAISIGDPASGGMTYSASYSDWTWWHYRSVMAFMRNDNLTDAETGSTASVWALYYDGKAEAMNWTGSDYVGDLGSRMVGCGSPGCTATLADGTVLTFQTAPTSVSHTGDIYLLASAVKPTGERHNYYYFPGSHAIRAITNGFGYQLRFVGTWQQPSSVVLFNMAVDACSPSAASCTFSRTWPQLSFEYSGASVSAVVETSGARTLYRYGSVSQRLEEIDGPGTADVSIRYQNCGPLPPFGQCHAGGEFVGGFRVESVAKGGRTWNYSWDPALTNTQNPEHGVRVTNAAGYTGYRTAVTTFFGNGIFDIYPVADHIISVKDPLSRVTSFEHAGQLNTVVAKITHPEGNGAQYTYDQRMNLTKIRRFAKPGSALPDQVIDIEYAELGDTTNCVQPAYCNKPLRVRDARGYVTRFTWTTSGRLNSVERGLQGPSTSLTCALGTNLCPKASFGYTALRAYYLNSAGVMTAGAGVYTRTSVRRCENGANCAAANEIVTTLGYGPTGVANNLLLRTSSVSKNGVARTTGFSYDAVGNRVEINGPRTDVSDITEFGWDLDRRPTMEVYAEESATQRTYTPEGYLFTVSRGTSVGVPQFSSWETATHQYDSGGNLIKITTRAGITQMSYDSAGRLTCTAQRMVPSTFASLPNDACLLSTPSSAPVLDRITKNIYNAAGQITTIQRAYLTPLAQNYASYAYTANGQQDWVQDAKGNRSDYTYDGFDRLARFNFPSATVGANVANPSDYEAYGYDANGNRTSRQLRSGETIASHFDAVNREWWRDFPGSDTNDVYFGYDLLDRMRWARHQSTSGQGIDYSYDAWGGILTEVAYGRTLAFEYDEAGNRKRLTWPDLNFVEYTFDAMNRMDQVRENGAVSGAGLLANYGYDVLGRRSSVRFGNGTEAGWRYDGSSRVLTVIQDIAGTAQDLTLGFSYNNASQVLTRTLSNDNYQYVAAAATQSYTPDGLNRYTGYTYDGRGNLKNNGVRVFTYDLENHLTRVDAAAGSPTLLNLSYDPLGRLKQTAGASTSQFLYAGDQLVAEYNAAGGMVSRYVHGSSVDEPLVWYAGSTLSDSTRQWLHANQQGSVVGVTGSTGALVGTPYSYSAYGEPDSDHAWAGPRFRYTGQIALPEIQLYHYKARVFDPTIGRFLQTDPINYSDQMNLYAYVGNDPANKTDPTGEVGVPGFLIGAGIETFVQVATNMAAGQGFGEALSNVDVGDVLVAGAVSAVIPGVYNAAKTGVKGGKVIANSRRARETLTAQSGRTTNRAAKLKERIAAHSEKINAAVQEVDAAVGTATVHQVIKFAGEGATPPVTITGGQPNPDAASQNPATQTPPTAKPPDPPCRHTGTGPACTR